MSETEPIPPTSSVTALRIPIIKKDADLYGKPIKARFGGNEASPPKKMQKEFYANLKFLRSLPSVWHVVATMIRGQPGLDELDFDDLYNNLKVILLESVDLLNIPGKQSIGRNEMRQHEDIDCDQGFDAVNTDDDQYSLALMATISEVPYCSKGSMSYKKLLKALKLKVPSPKEDLLFHQQYLKGNGFDKNSSSYHLQLLSRRESSTKFHDYASLTVDALDSMTGDRTCCLILKEFKGGYVALDMTSKVFKNQLMNRVCAKKGIKSDIAHCQDSHRQMVLQKERTVYIEEVVRCRDSLLPIQFWAEAVNTACYVLNRVLVTKPQMKLPYGNFDGKDL
ncbi:hypothetical protein Tco_0823774 [Tanacetum coccineum]|uniref:Uncharacterized protein n=1 Tax=Tanacetum coccineum TaxID=301880 RepID=A0ABQ5AIV3_9ASTR